MDWQPDIIFPIIGALFAGAAVGLEREFRGQPAGLRTHLLVCLASAFLMLMSVEQGQWAARLSADTVRIDPVRLAHGVLTGIGFLCGGVIFLPLFLQVVTGVSATNSGLLILPLTAGIVVGSVGSGRVISHTGRYRAWPIGGLGLGAVGMALLSTMTASTSIGLSSIYMIVLGLGTGAAMQVTVLVVQNAADHRDLGVATSSIQFFRQMGGLFGVAVFGAIMNARLAVELPRRLPPAAVRDVAGDVTALLNSPAAIRAMPPAVARAIADSVEASIQTVFVWAVPLMILGFILAWALKEVPLRDTVGPPPVEPTVA